MQLFRLRAKGLTDYIANGLSSLDNYRSNTAYALYDD